MSNQLRQKIEQAGGAGIRLSDETVDAILQTVINELATPEFVYEVMNSPTNGVGVEYVKTILTAAMSIGGDDE